jgi:alcohol dehydrogenase (cytochrome c)
VAEDNGYSIFYLTDVDPRGSMGLGGKEEVRVGTGGSFLTAIYYRTGEIAWRRAYYAKGGGGGLLSTAGKLLFGGDGAGNLVAYNITNGKPVWHTHVGNVTNAPQTYMLDGHQYLIAATGDTLWSFLLY